MKISGHWFTKSESVIILLQECWTVAEKHIFCFQSFSLFSCFSEVTTFSFQMKDKCFSLTSKQLLLVIEQLPKYNSSPYFQTWNLSKKIKRPDFWANNFYTLKTDKLRLFLLTKKHPKFFFYWSWSFFVEIVVEIEMKM